jgi:6-carboxyhexanoate--CoA ligase
MDTLDLSSVRMRASLAGRHISGAERIVPRERIDAVTAELRERATSRGADSVHVTVEPLDGSGLLFVASLNILLMKEQDVLPARRSACGILEQCGVSPAAARSAVDALASGPSPSGDVMRGAMLIDALSGERLEPDRERGVRASRFDWTDDASRVMDARLHAAGLSHFRTKEALALATKVSRCPGIVAELCWSDDRDYTAGYVAAPSLGYLRFPCLREAGESGGGRAFFVAPGTKDISRIVDFLRRVPVLIDRPGLCSGPMQADDLPARL